MTKKLDKVHDFVLFNIHLLYDLSKQIYGVKIPQSLFCH
jgi:hypothetical protein